MSEIIFIKFVDYWYFFFSTFLATTNKYSKLTSTNYLGIVSATVVVET